MLRISVSDLISVYSMSLKWGRRMSLIKFGTRWISGFNVITRMGYRCISSSSKACKSLSFMFCFMVYSKEESCFIIIIGDESGGNRSIIEDTGAASRYNFYTLWCCTIASKSRTRRGASFNHTSITAKLYSKPSCCKHFNIMNADRRSRLVDSVMSDTSSSE